MWLGTNLAVNSITNLLQTNQSQVGSGFFPTAQREKIVSEITQPAGGAGQTYRTTSPDAPSIFETVKMALQGWIGTPYQQQYSVPAKVTESKQLADVVTTKPADKIEQGLDWAIEQTKKVTTLWDQIKSTWDKPREVIAEKPRAGYPEGQNLIHYNDEVDRGANVAEQILVLGKQFYDQVKGLFGLGYPSTGTQPVATVEHEVSLAGGLNWGIVLIIAIVLYLVTKK
ncbi:MAG: hypothetical protein AMJ79_11845 [Phycisphaerae bacterium SM23_30]|nr:MAG: hypothetical protein AMJ79_11845 [Phycisphaerae bacterium SM23_30]